MSGPCHAPPHGGAHDVERLRALTAAIAEADARRLALVTQRDAEVRRSGLGPRALARAIDVTPATAARIIARCRRTQ